MNNKPHFVLFSGIGEQSSQHKQQGGSWHFQLESTSNGQRLEASDVETGISAERLELLAVVRGLEALEQPSHVTLMTSSRVVSRGIRQGIEQWRRDGWVWERFGEQVPIKNGDLWRRVDRALEIHAVECRRVRIDAAHEPSRPRLVSNHGSRRRLRMGRLVAVPRAICSGGQTLATWLHKTADWLQRVVPQNQPKPHPLM